MTVSIRRPSTRTLYIVTGTPLAIVVASRRCASNAVPASRRRR
jgi:hypothetical protein